MLNQKNKLLFSTFVTTLVLTAGLSSSALANSKQKTNDSQQTESNVVMMAGGEAAINCEPLKAIDSINGEPVAIKLSILPAFDLSANQKSTTLVTVEINGKMNMALRFKDDMENSSSQKLVLKGGEGLGSLIYEKSKTDSKTATLKLDNFLGQTGEVPCSVDSVSVGS